MDGGGKKEGKCSYHDLSGSLGCQNWPNKENLPKEGGITGAMHHNIIHPNPVFQQFYSCSVLHSRSLPLPFEIRFSAAIPDPFGQNFRLKIFKGKQLSNTIPHYSPRHDI